MTGYTYQEIDKFGFYNWTLIATRKATAKEVENDFVGCQDYEECPCCNCGADVVFVQKFARPRWSKSGKCVVEETSTRWVCSEHA